MQFSRERPQLNADSSRSPGRPERKLPESEKLGSGALTSWLKLQRERLALLLRAFQPADGHARNVILASLRRRALMRRVRLDAAEEAAHEIDVKLYQIWIERFDELRSDDVAVIRQHIAQLRGSRPLLLMLFDADSSPHAAEAVRHLRKQLFADFDAWLHFPEDCAEADVKAAKRAAAADARFRILREPFATADLPPAGADTVILAEGGVFLREHALYLYLAAACEAPERCLVYADEDHLDRAGIRRRPKFKPIFSPELLRRRSYLGPCVLLRGESIDIPALFRRGPEGIGELSRETALALGGEAVRHIPFVAYHDVRDRLDQTVIRGELLLPDQSLPTVSIIIPTRDKLDLLEPCLVSIRERTAYPGGKYEILVVDNGSRDPEMLGFLREAASSGAIRLIKDGRDFNYAHLSNLGESDSSGEVLVFLNNDTVVEDSNWLKLMVSQAMQDDVAAVGAKLLYPDGTVQFGGTVLGIQAVAGHAHVGLDKNDGGYRGMANVTHEVSALTGACLAIRRKVFEELGRFDEELAVACNDVLLCVEALERGYRNLYIGRPLMVHCESKSRGFDDTQEKRELFLEEARHMRSKHRRIFRDDPYYSSNLSYERTYELAFPPRREKPWRTLARKDGPLRVLMLSIVHERGHGVPVVLQKQAEHLARLGHKVLVGGPTVHGGIRYEGCELVRLNDPGDAAAYSVSQDIDVIVAHTPPFYSVVRWLGDWPRCILYDYGEPPIQWFDDAAGRRRVHFEKRLVFGIAEQVFAISEAVRAEIARDDVGVIPLGNTHLSTWSDASLRRERARRARGFGDRVVVLNVCRFHRAERRYKGVDHYAQVAQRFRSLHPDLGPDTVFVLCGKAAAEDVEQAEALGLTVIANASDAELIDLYAAADIYMNFSQWEGYNLGIGQALAFGLPVIASDIAAHREFGVMTRNETAAAVSALEALVSSARSGALLHERKPKLWSWDAPLAQFAEIIERTGRA
jgi:GT2 family glycosyltransferase/glycosyltransferase involved in cell wall biosynthesis